MLHFEAEETMSSHNSRNTINDSIDSDSDLDLNSFEYDDAVDSTVAEVDFLGQEKLVNKSTKLSSNPATLLSHSDQSVKSKYTEKCNISGEEILTGKDESSSVIIFNSSHDCLTDSNDTDIKVTGDDQITKESSYMNACLRSSDKKDSCQKKSVKKIKQPKVVFSEKTNYMFPKQDFVSLGSELNSGILSTLEKKCKDGNISSNKSAKKLLQVGFLRQRNKDTDLQHEEELYTCKDSAEGIPYLEKPGEFKDDKLLISLMTSGASIPLSDDADFFKSLPGENEDVLPPYVDNDYDVALVSLESKQTKNRNLTAKNRKVSQYVESRTLQSLTQKTEDSLPRYGDSDNEVQSSSSASRQRQNSTQITIPKNFSKGCYTPRTVSQVKEDSLPPYVDNDEDPSSSLKPAKFLTKTKQQDNSASEREKTSQYKTNTRKRKYPEIDMADSTFGFPVPSKLSKTEKDGEGKQNKRCKTDAAEYWTCLVCTVTNKNEVTSCLVCDTPKHIPGSEATRDDPKPLSPTLTEDDIIHKVQEIFPNVSWFYLVKSVKNMCEKNPDRNAVLLEIVDSFSTNPYPTNPDFSLYQRSPINMDLTLSYDVVQESNEKGKGKMPLRRFSQKSSSPSFVTSSIEPGPSSSIADVSSSVSDSDIRSECGVSSSEATRMRCDNCPLMELSTKISECCDEHPLCVTCVEKAAKEALAGKKMGPVMCPKPGCQSSVPKSQLQNVLPNIIMDLLEDKWLKEVHDAVEDMEGLVKCPSCNFKVFMDPDAKMFQCPDCSKITCRYCQKDWAGDDHNGCTANRNSSMTTEMETATSGHTFAFPPNWDITSDMDKSYIKVPLKSDAPEYLHVMAEFQRSGGISHTIRNIYRVQNPRLWQKYSLQKSHMLEDLGLNLLNEKHLYHGTDDDAVEKICKEGFDWRLCGVHGTAYGNGTYFALDAAVSCSYSSSRHGSGLFALTVNPFQIFSRYMGPAVLGGSANGNIGNLGALQTFANNSSAPSLSGVGDFNTPQSSINSSFTFGRPIQGSLNSGFTVGGQSTSGNSNTGFTFGNSNIPKGFPFVSQVGSSLSSTSNFHLPPPALGFSDGTSPGTNTNNLLQQMPFNPSFGQNCFPSSSGASFQQPSRFMFYAKVLVGQCCRGDTSMKKPPINQNDPHQRPYNSVVDQPSNPRIFVIFDSSQTYPEYLIEFV
ncbi:hypothetical protein ACJMK2_019778 [Sinanodonta woodiana]|uniref:Poly [ADP-ribose] polymerase n=1 Tax=Sinanodonta woodiana TaxID=1069815 RepID=A0ABD3TWX3_SINWO